MNTEPNAPKLVETGMQKNTLLLFFLLLFQNANTQAIPYGFRLSMNGKLQYIEGDQNHTGMMKYPAAIKCGGSENFLEDIRNIQIDYLTILEPPREWLTAPSSQDPSIIGDSSRAEFLYNHDLPVPGIDSNLYLYLFVDTDVIISQPEENPKVPERKFVNEAVGLNLTNERLVVLEQKLRDYVKTYSGRVRPYEAEEALRQELSTSDSTVDGMSYYDYIADKLVFYNYDDRNRITSAVGYYFANDVEFDTMRYDAAGNMTWFLRESISGSRDEYLLEYNAYHQIVKVTFKSTYIEDMNDENDQPYVEVTAFGYNDMGMVKSKSILNPDGSWSTCSFERMTKMDEF